MATATRNAKGRFIKGGGAMRRSSRITRRATVRRKKPQMTVPLAVVAGFIPPAAFLWSHKDSGPAVLANDVGRIFTGWDGATSSWSWRNLRLGAFPVLGGFAIHMLAGRIGLNRVLARAGVPLLRI